jgi:uncharacterized membrane protein YphA (DoxX/SURF4 family)
VPKGKLKNPDRVPKLSERFMMDRANVDDRLLHGIVLAAGEGRRLQLYVQEISGDALLKRYVKSIGRRSMLDHVFQGRSENQEGTMARIRGFSSLFLRLALGVSFLSAVADRFGLWGAFGRPNVSWGNFPRFVSYTGKLNWFLPEALIPAVAIIATCAEALLGLCLVIGWHTRTAALLSGILLILFGVTMAVALGVKAPLDFSVFSAAGGALLLVTCTDFPFGVDKLRRSR